MLAPMRKLNGNHDKVRMTMAENIPDVEHDPENPVEGFAENMPDEQRHSLVTALPGVERALAFMRKRHVEALEALPLEADVQVRVARAGIKAIDELHSDLQQLAATGEREVGTRIQQRVGRPNRR